MSTNYHKLITITSKFFGCSISRNICPLPQDKLDKFINDKNMFEACMKQALNEKAITFQRQTEYCIDFRPKYET